MASYIMDLALVSIVVIGLTATMGVIANSIGEKFFGGKTGSDIFNRDKNVKAGWKTVGGRQK